MSSNSTAVLATTEDYARLSWSDGSPVIVAGQRPLEDVEFVAKAMKLFGYLPDFLVLSEEQSFILEQEHMDDIRDYVATETPSWLLRGHERTVLTEYIGEDETTLFDGSSIFADAEEIARLESLEGDELQAVLARIVLNDLLFDESLKVQIMMCEIAPQAGDTLYHLKQAIEKHNRSLGYRSWDAEVMVHGQYGW